MFGMSDPTQTLVQIERYIQDGRLEMSEVMCTQFTEMLMADKKRDANKQMLLVKGLRMFVDVLLIRNKPAKAVSAVSSLIRERKKLTSLLSKHAPELLSKMTPPSEDFRRAGVVYAKNNKAGKAKKFFAKCEKLAPNHLAAANEAVALLEYDKTLTSRLLKSCKAAGPVIRRDGIFVLEPEGLPSCNVDELLKTLESVQAKGSHISECAGQAARIRAEMEAIERGEAAENARLQNALDTLKPKHDYYEY